MDISGGSAVITGGAGGFGGATARRLAKMGASVVIADVAVERGKALAAEIGNGSFFVRTAIEHRAEKHVLSLSKGGNRFSANNDATTKN